MNNSLNIVDLAVLKKVASDFGMLGDNYLVAYIKPEELAQELLSVPMSIMGLALCVLKQGHAIVNIDFKDIEMGPNSLMAIDLNTRFCIKSVAETGADVFLMCFSRNFLHDLNFDLHTLNLHELVDNRPDAVVNLIDEEVTIIEGMAQVLLNNAKYNSEPTFSLQIARSVTQALIYQQLQLLSNRRPKAPLSQSPTGSRQLAYVQEFIQQLQLHHTHHRDLAFYADKLCISQKYLSHVIKEATGRSATEWIAEYVVMEAKNLLRYSNKNVQQVAYSLNFPTQSSFGKYFKHVTGISPSEFLKT